MQEKPLSGLWRYSDQTPEGKYLVKRRDGTIPEWPNFVIGAKDPCAPAALRAYAREAEALGLNPDYIADIYTLAGEFQIYRYKHGTGDPDRGRYRKDDPATVAEMRSGHGS